MYRCSSDHNGGTPGERRPDISDFAGGTKAGCGWFDSVLCREMPSPDSVIPLRPHHGMCLAYFVGKGYSEGFSAHMERMLSLLLTDVPVRLTVSADRICEACPNNRDGCCVSRDKVEGYDRAVLACCGFQEGQVLSFLDFAGAVQKNVMDAGLRGEICGRCQWSDICDHQESRWKGAEK